MNKKKIQITNKDWEDILEEMNKLFPKGVSKDRGKAMVFLAQIFIILNIRH
jgi:hypothetical protein